MTSSLVHMKTEISRFCQDYSEILLPLRATLGKGIDFIRDQRENEDLKPTISGLCDVHHRLKNLTAKVDAQQAYVIIFGPLKSGKSTLMNAFSAAYVSEVTALPAYPCLVHVRHEEKVDIVASRFNGKTEKFKDYRQMQEAVGVYHRELAEQIRKVEEKGETFDPGVHCPDAIRRLDIGLPAEPLKESYTILVDTPGLYSRMKFGYDLMSREFRNSAACAVFVVKTDNLFLEQVFAEFNDLLDLFSRIFLVVNIDTDKCDLSPDGELIPSLEGREPQKVVDAFCSLSMSAPLRKAYDEGRLKIYPIDLLHAATERMSDHQSNPGSGSDLKPDEEQLDFEPESDFGDGVAESENPGQNSDLELNSQSPAAPFADFMGDLTNYLNSNEYLIHFMCDSLRQGRNLVREIEQYCDERNLQGFINGQASLELQYERETARREALGRLEQLDWNRTLSAIDHRIRRATTEFVQAEQQRLQEKLFQEVDIWFEDTESMATLLSERIEPQLEKIPEQLRQFVMDQMRQATGTPMGGAKLSEEATGDLEKAGISLNTMKEKAMAAALQVGQETELPARNINVDSMPVRKKFWDWILVRSVNRVRERLFGPDANPDREISLKDKQNRLGERSRNCFRDALEDHLEDVFSSLSETLSKGMTDAYMESATSSIRQLLSETCKQLDQSLPKLKKRFEAKAAIRKTLAELAGDTLSFDRQMESLEQSFAELHPMAEWDQVVREEEAAEDDQTQPEVTG